RVSETGCQRYDFRYKRNAHGMHYKWNAFSDRVGGAPKDVRGLDSPHFAGEDITDTAHALDHPRCHAQSVDLAPQPCHMPVDHAIERIPILTFEHVHHFVTR